MADHTFEDFLTETKLLVKSCPDETLTYAVQRAVRIFCRESWIYEKTIILPLVNDLDVYPLNLSGNDEVIAIKAVTYNDWVLVAQRPEDVWFTKDGDMPFVYMFEPPNLLYLRPTPHNVTGDETVDEEPAICRVRMVLQPQEGSDFIPDQIYRQYKEAVAAGAVSYCYMMPNESWTNPTLGAYYEKKFYEGINEAKRRRMAGFKWGPLRVRPRTFLMT